jgi:hypothetical protein
MRSPVLSAPAQQASQKASTLAAALSLLAALSACPPPEQQLPPPPPPDDECELDVNFDTTGAADLDDDGVGSGVLCPAFDQDFFAFDVDAAGTIVTIQLSMDTALTRVNPAYRIIKDNGTPDGVPTPFSGEDPDKTQGDATNFVASHRLDEAGRYYVLVFDARFVEDTFDISNPYTLQVTLTPDPDDNEPNNTDDLATPITSGTPITGQIATSEDEDWYSIEVPAGAKLIDIEVAAAADVDIDHDVIVFAADGQTQVSSANLSDEGPIVGSLSARVRVRVEGGARTYIVVKDRTGDNASLDPADAYTLTAVVVDNPDENETPAGNDTAATATRVNSGTELQAVLASTADVDVYRLTPPANASRATPSVLIIGVDIDGVDPRTFRPQVQVVGVDPELNADQQGCGASCSLCDQNVCKEARLQRFIPEGTYQTAVPLRDARDVLIIVNEFGDDAFQEGAGYSIRFEVVADPDDGEGDDVLLPNLEFAGFANEGDLRRQFQQSKGRARPLVTNYAPVCTGEATDPLDCLPLIDVPTPIPGVPEAFTRMVDCSAPGTGPQTVSFGGHLTYEGDRDYFRVDLPSEGYWALDFDYSLQGAGTTPIELTLFVRANDGLIANTLEAEQTQGNCLDTVDCPDGSICVDGACWADGLQNPTFASRIFPEGEECAFVSVVNRNDRPIYLEVTDNGINDFDIDVSYSFDLTIRCGCPPSCNRGAGNCQGAPAPN